MPSHHTYNKDRVTELKRDLRGTGEYDADGCKITTYRINSKNQLVRSIDGKLDNTGKEVTKYRHCRKEKYYRLDTEGTLTEEEVNKLRQEVKQPSTKSGLTAEIKEQRAGIEGAEERNKRLRAIEARTLQDRGGPSGTSTRGTSGQHRTASRERQREIPRGQGRTLTDAQIEEQTREDVTATGLYHEPDTVSDHHPVGSQNSSDRPPSYGNHTKDYKPIQTAGPAEGPRNANPPPFSSKPSSVPGPTGQTPYLSTRLPKDPKPPTSWGGRHKPGAPLSFSGGESENKSSSSEKGSHGNPSSSEGVFHLSSDGPNPAPKKVVPSKAQVKKPSEKAPVGPIDSSASSNGSPPRFLPPKGDSKTGGTGSERRGTSQHRKDGGKGKGKQPAKKNPAKGSSSGGGDESSTDDRYGS
ncbi:hypothetical protein EAE96_004604 [Botrytis aclada]|nr:hypothetical protein EAE96_004604 [Botrytis aclada]